VQAVMALLSVLHQGRAGGKADIVLPLDGFSLPPAALAARFGLSLRQFERRFRASYGQSLRGLRQQLRCSQLMRFVAGRPSGAGTWADVAARFGYCDQSHLIHDVLRFTGYTPGQLAAGVASDDPAFWPYRVAPHHMTRLFGPSGY
jgi:AraC-like DNA-binding protein